MTKSPDAEGEIEYVQRNSRRLANGSADGFPAAKPLHETTTVAVRLIRSDADAISALAASHGVPLSTLLRTWVLAGLRSEQGDSIGATLTDLEQGLRRLRKALG
jgi:hypothetical protein